MGGNSLDEHKTIFTIIQEPGEQPENDFKRKKVRGRRYSLGELFIWWEYLKLEAEGVGLNEASRQIADIYSDANTDLPREDLARQIQHNHERDLGEGVSQYTVRNIISMMRKLRNG